VEVFDAADVEAHVVAGAVLTELLAAGRELADEVGEGAVVGLRPAAERRVATTSRAMRSQSR
jgi:hypothetical protein